MTSTQLLAKTLEGDVGMLKMTLGDFTDADMLARPTPAANHAMWQLGHLVLAEHSLVNSASPGAVPPAPETFAGRFTKEAAKSNDPAAFPSKDEVIGAFEKVRAETIKWVQTLSDEDFGRSTPLSFAPTIGQLVVTLSGHTMMHVGQFQVIRRKLGKPVLF